MEPNTRNSQRRWTTTSTTAGYHPSISFPNFCNSLDSDSTALDPSLVNWKQNLYIALICITPPHRKLSRMWMEGVYWFFCFVFICHHQTNVTKKHYLFKVLSYFVCHIIAFPLWPRSLNVSCQVYFCWLLLCIQCIDIGLWAEGQALLLHYIARDYNIVVVYRKISCLGRLLVLVGSWSRRPQHSSCLRWVSAGAVPALQLPLCWHHYHRHNNGGWLARLMRR